jgi:hypothetical protein
MNIFPVGTHKVKVLVSEDTGKEVRMSLEDMSTKNRYRARFSYENYEDLLSDWNQIDSDEVIIAIRKGGYVDKVFTMEGKTALEHKYDTDAVFITEWLDNLNR